MNIVERLMELVANWNAGLLDAEWEQERKCRAATEVWFEWPDGEIKSYEVYTWIGGYVFEDVKYLAEREIGERFQPGFVNVKSAVQCWVETKDLEPNFKNQHFIYEMLNNSYIVTQYRDLQRSMQSFDQMLQDHPELLADD